MVKTKEKDEELLGKVFDYEAFGRAIWYRRQELGLGQYEVLERLPFGASRAYLSKLENAYGQVPLGRAVKIMMVLDMDLNQLKTDQFWTDDYEKEQT